MNIQEIERLVDLVAASRVSEVSVKVDGCRVTVRRRKRRAPAAPEGPPASVSAAVQPSNVVEPAASEAGHLITAPLVGIFHPPSPRIAAGARVRKDQVVGAIESMKLMNDVRADCDGLVEAVLVEPGMPVEYGQPLYRLAADALLAHAEPEEQRE
jgi:acetyl-CoA carboxylase biotin carboxyl carrier protein